ncbi:MAG: PmoA family protein [Bryobacteraceae bacterium]
MSSTRRWFLAGAGVAAAGWKAPTGDEVHFVEGSRALFTYQHGKDRPKPYVHPLYAPDGTALTLDSPFDHVHHRGLMLAWSAINGFDFWGETTPGRHGQIIDDRFLKQDRRRLTARNEWRAEGELLLSEIRTIAAPKQPKDVTLVDWESELTAETKVLLSAGKHPYNGLGVRVTPSMDFGDVLNSAGTTEIKKANGEPAVWCAYHGKVAAGWAGIAMFNHPGNPRHPTPFFVMNDKFGYMTAAPTFYDSFPLEKGERIRFRWRVAAWNGRREKMEIDRMYKQWEPKA